jgi:hypothetical protein
MFEFLTRIGAWTGRAVAKDITSPFASSNSAIVFKYFQRWQSHSFGLIQSLFVQRTALTDKRFAQRANPLLQRTN